MDFNDCWCISFTLSTAAAAVANPIIRNGMDPLHAVPVIANYLSGIEKRTGKALVKS